MRWFCISNDADVLTGMRLAGIDGVMAGTAAEVDAAVTRAVQDEGIAVLIVTEMFFIPLVWILSISPLGLLGVQMSQSVSDLLTLAAAVPIQLYVLRHLAPAGA